MRLQKKNQIYYWKHKWGIINDNEVKKPNLSLQTKPRESKPNLLLKKLK